MYNIMRCFPIFNQFITLRMRIIGPLPLLIEVIRTGGGDAIRLRRPAAQVLQHRQGYRRNTAARPLPHRPPPEFEKAGRPGQSLDC
jgi:hypothetical protein